VAAISQSQDRLIKWSKSYVLLDNENLEIPISDMDNDKRLSP
jgi:hypothetical protein